jgi:hypothetical protein
MSWSPVIFGFVQVVDLSENHLRDLVGFVFVVVDFEIYVVKQLLAGVGIAQMCV